MHVHQAQGLQNRALSDVNVRATVGAHASETEIVSFPFCAFELHFSTDVEIQVTTGKARVVELRRVAGGLVHKRDAAQCQIIEAVNLTAIENDGPLRGDGHIATGGDRAVDHLKICDGNVFAVAIGGRCQCQVTTGR